MTAEVTVVPGTARPVPALLTDPAWHTALAAVREQAAIDTREPAAIIELLTRAVECAEHDGDRALAESGRVRTLNFALTHNDHAGVRAIPVLVLERGRNRNALCCGATVPSETNR